MGKFFISCLLIFLLISIVSAQNPQDIDKSNEVAEALLNRNPKQSIDTAARTKSAAEKINYKKGVARAIAIIGIANFKIDDYPKAKMLIAQSASISQGLNDTSGLAFCKYWLGNVELNQGRYSNALDLYQSAKNLAVKSGDKKNMARSLDGEASIYETLNEDDKALELYQQAFAIAKEASFTTWYPGILLSLGNIAYNKDKIDEAVDYYNEAIKKSDEVGNLNNKADCYQQLAAIYNGKKEPKEAMKYVQQAMDLFQQTGSASSYSHSRLLMSDIFLSNGDYGPAIELAVQSLDEGRQTHETALQESAAEILYYAWLKKGDKAKALNYLMLFHEFSEANHKEALAKKVAQMELMAGFEKEKEKARIEQTKRDGEMNARLQKKNLLNKFSFIGIFMLAIIAGLAIFAFTQNRKDSNLIAAEKKKTDTLLLSILPEEIVSELKSIEYKADNLATVLFANIKSPDNNEENKVSADGSGFEFYSRVFDPIIAKYQIEKIKTIDDAYVCVGNLPVADKKNASNVVSAALEMKQYIEKVKAEGQGKDAALPEISMGIHTGPLIAGIVGIRKFSYDIWGDTVNIAARMEQRGEKGKVNISGVTYRLIKEQFVCVLKGEIEPGAKDKKEKIEMYIVEGALNAVVQS